MDTRKLKVASVREIAEDITEYRLVAPDGSDLPAFTAGAHLHVSVPSGGTRQYSLCNDPAEHDSYVIAVKREADGKGGSVSLIRETKVGDEIEVSLPRNDFELKRDAGKIILIAGGIGITPILCMARVLHRERADFRMYYLTRSPELTAYRDELLQGPFSDRVTVHHDFGDPAQSIDLAEVFRELEDTVVYCCGPTGLLHAVRSNTAGWPHGSVRFEDFGNTAPEPEGEGFWVSLDGRSDRYWVPPEKTILQVLQDAGLDMPSSCEAGTCGTCRMTLLSGKADHRDLVLFDEEMDDNIIICCSRALSNEIVIAFPDQAGCP